MLFVFILLSVKIVTSLNSEGVCGGPTIEVYTIKALTGTFSHFPHKDSHKGGTPLLA